MEYAFTFIFIFIGGLLLGLSVMWLTGLRRRRLKQSFEGIVNRVLEERSATSNKMIRDTFENADRLVKGTFENADKLVKDTFENADKQIKSALDSKLEPFRRDMENLQKSVVDSSKEKHSLAEQIQKIGSQANNLAEALTHNPKMQGNWGEVVLQKMLEDSGLRKDKDYKLQDSLKGNENESLRPDVVLYLPENKHIVVDSKLSLVNYKNYIEEEDETYKQNYLKTFYNNTKKHIEDLAGKKYNNAKDIESPDFTIMFMPIEGAFVTLMQGNSDLQKFAWDKHIVIAAPSILFAMLQTVSSLWRLNRQNKNADEIARLAGSLYDKIAQFDDDMKGLGNKISKLNDDFEDTHRKLSTGRGNILTRTETLRRIGAKTTKKLDIDLENEIIIEN